MKTSISTIQKKLVSVTYQINDIVACLTQFEYEKGLDDIVKTGLTASKKKAIRFIRKEISKCNTVVFEKETELNNVMSAFNKAYIKAVSFKLTKADVKYLNALCDTYNLALAKISELNG